MFSRAKINRGKNNSRLKWQIFLRKNRKRKDNTSWFFFYKNKEVLPKWNEIKNELKRKKTKTPKESDSEGKINFWQVLFKLELSIFRITGKSGRSREWVCIVKHTVIKQILYTKPIHQLFLRGIVMVIFSILKNNKRKKMFL